tara:strand:- start:23 stop:556 length:534 start_codon:yes stop_codon:yes gene_type:complete
MTFSDESIEKLFIFLRYLNKKLPKNTGNQLDISDSVDLDSLRIQKTFEGGSKLDHGSKGQLDPHDFDTGTQIEDEQELLSELIKLLNERFGSNLTEEDKLDIDNLRKRVFESENLSTYLKGDNSSTNKKKFFADVVDNVLLDYVNDRFGFYKKMEDKKLKNYIVKSLYESYTRQISN